MKIKVYPSIVTGQVKIPASKSVVHRALIASALSIKENIITNVSFNEDIYATINALKGLGAKIEVKDKTIYIKGFDLKKQIESVEIDAKESGSTLRFLIPLASYKSKKLTLSGSKRLMERPLGVYKDIYKSQNLEFIDEETKVIKGKLKAGNYVVRGDISSQFISGLLFLLPILELDSTLEVLKPFESKPYVDLTIFILKKYNIHIETVGNKYYVKGNQNYQPHNLSVEGDFSQAAFFAVLATINNDLVIDNIDKQSIQGDKQITDFLKKMNVKTEFGENKLKVYKSNPVSQTLDLADSPDLGPILCVLGLFTDKSLTLTNVRRLRLKESDRLLAMKTQLEKIGAKVDLSENSITVYKLERFTDKEITVDGSNDHRIVMSLAILATVLSKPLVIKGAKAINKSYPNFFKDLNELGVKTEWL